MMSTSGGTLDLEGLKRDAARAALTEVHSGMTLGLGTGSTMRHFLEALGEALQDGGLSAIRGVPTSRDTEDRARALNIPLVELHEVEGLDLAVDGADEVDPQLDLIKGLGGALVREKMVVQAARRFIVLADSTKAVGRLGEKAPLPVEVISFGWASHLPVLRALGGTPVLRRMGGSEAGEVYCTDNGNHILDVWFPDGISDPGQLQQILQARAGILDTGLFLQMADRCYLAEGSTIRVLDRPTSPVTGDEA